jgi:hypothetical protein
VSGMLFPLGALMMSVVDSFFRVFTDSICSSYSVSRFWMICVRG